MKTFTSIVILVLVIGAALSFFRALVRMIPLIIAVVILGGMFTAVDEHGSPESRPPDDLSSAQFSCPLHAYWRDTSDYGWRTSPINGRETFHNGIDMAVDEGTPVYASCSGTVQETGYSDVYGNYIIISHGNGVAMLYGHLSKTYVSSGDATKNGTCIGLTGSTGMSTGPHLHFAVFKDGKPVEPEQFIAGTER
jgi:murein DD-endopeptidase MepM/ murein hydrolase activator NlpD